MPNFQPQAAAIRTSGYSIRCYASFYAPDPIIEATCAGLSGAYPIRNLFVNIDGGDYTDILPGMRIDIYDSTGSYLKGRTRIRFGNMITPNSFPVREFSPAAIDLAANDKIFVYPDIRLADKLVEANQLFSPDGTPFTDEGSNPPPLACSGGHWAGRVDDGQTFATVPMTGSNSDVVDPDSTPGNVSHLWTLPTGVAFQAGSSSTDADPVLEADVGQHLILHTVTDDDNSKATTQSVVVVVTDDSTPPHRVMVTSYEGKPESGFNGEVEVISGSVDTDSIPDGCLCILWGRERISNAWQSIRNNSDGREHLLAAGYVRRERIRRAADGVNHLSLEFTSPLSRLREITAYSKVMEENASPDAWNEIKTLSVKRAYLQLIQFYSTLVESGFDLLIDADFLDERYPAFYLQRSTIAGMLDELAHGQDARTTCDRTGQFSLHTEPPFIPYGDRGGITVMWALTAQDILDAEINVDHYPTVELYKTSGFSGGASGNSPVFSLYPGDAPGEGIQTPTRDRLIVDATTPQDDLNERTGRYGALADRALVDGDGNRSPAAEVTLTLRGAYNFFDFRKEYVTLTDNYGRRLFSGARFYPTSVSASFDGRGVASTSVTLMQETNAAAGATYTPPPQDGTYPPPNDYPLPPPISPLPFFGIGRGVNTMYAVNTDGYIYGTANFQRTAAQGGAAWAREDLGLADDPIDAVQDAFTTSKLIVVTVGATDAIYTVEGVGTTSLTVTARKTLRAAIANQNLQWRMVDASFGADYVVVVSYYGNSGADSGVWYTYSTNGGVTWSTETQITAHYSSTAGANVPGLFVSSRAPGEAYIGVFTASGATTSADASIYRLSGTFGSPASYLTLNDAPAYCIHKSWADGDQTLYYSTVNFTDGASTRNRIYRKVGSGSAVEITPTIGGNKQRAIYGRAFHTCPVDANTILAAVAGNTTSGVVMSRDKGSTWTQISAGTTTDYNGAEVAGNDRNVGYVWGSSGAIGYVNLTTGAIDDRRGNIPTDYPSIGRFVRIFSP